DDDERLGLLREMAGGHGRRPGRNDRCPCGSGRKYKHCHLGKEELALPERFWWLIDKGRAFLGRGRHDRLLGDLSGACDGKGPMPCRITHPDAGDPLVTDLALFDAGGWAEFLAARGALLPPDERSLAEAWTGARSGLYRVEAADGDGLVLAAVPGGSRCTADRDDVGPAPRPGRMYWCRLLHDGKGPRVASPLVRVRLAHRDGLAELLGRDHTALELATFLAGLAAPQPRFVNTDGEPLVLCTARYEVAAGPGPALGTRLTARGSDNGWDLFAGDDRSVVRATVRWDAGELTADANSVPRFDEIKALVAELVPDAKLLSEEREPILRAFSLHQPAVEDALADAAPAATDDELVAAEHARWLDQPLPVLGGLTPRAAAADPQRAADVALLLYDMEDSYRPGGPDVARLRQALGIVG
ncbi:MAG: SEC-C metal-binding domain-containing protein, partial [Acidimicrobiales bacterium]